MNWSELVRLWSCGLLVAIICLWLGVLTGCTRTVYVDRPVEVKVRVSNPCVEPGDIPPPMIYPVDQLELGVSDGDLIGALLADRTHRQAVEAALRAVLVPCSDPNLRGGAL